MANWLTMGQIFRVNAKKYPNTIALMDAERRYTFPESNRRINQLAHALLAKGITKGDRISCILENCIEICELYFAAAKIGAVINPVNFRVSSGDMAFIVDNAEAKLVVAHDLFADVVDEIRPKLRSVEHFVIVGNERDGYLPYEAFLEGQSSEEPEVKVMPSDTWILLYTSGTTGRPKGVVRSHESYIAFYLINGCDFQFSSRDIVLTAMPLCHVNTTFFSFAMTYLGGTNYIHPAIGFDALEILKIIEKHKITFISLIPTHYNLIMAIPEAERAKIDVSSLKKLLCSSAPARVEQKKAILNYFKGVELYEGYGSTEAGIVTTLLPHEQLTKPGSIGQESSGTDLIKILDPSGREVEQGGIGELYSRGPMMFDGYFKMPDVTANSFVGEYFSAGDMARQDEDGYYYLVDRKNNMIITGGEHVFPSEVEAVIASHPAVFDVAVIGVPDYKWTEAVKAIVVLHKGQTATEGELKQHAKAKLASYKCPKSIEFIDQDDMPRTATGKILHRILRDRYCQ